MTLPSGLFCVSDRCMRGMAEVTLVRGSEESLDDPASKDVVCQRVSFATSEFPIR